MPNLILARRVGETIVLNDETTITILEVQGRAVRVSIDAPRHVNIKRGEIVPKPDKWTPSTNTVAGPKTCTRGPTVTVRQRKR